MTGLLIIFTCRPSGAERRIMTAFCPVCGPLMEQFGCALARTLAVVSDS